MQTKKTFCSICSAFCGFEADVADNQIVDFRPDPEHPLSQGYSCTKGRQFPQLLSAKNRVSQAMARRAGALEPVSPETALDEIAAKLASIREQHGADAIAIFSGNGVQFKSFTVPLFRAWLEGLGSHNFFSTMTIDQPAKIIATGRHGVWAGGANAFDSADVAMLIGNNVLVSSLNQSNGPPGWRPGSIKEAKRRGLKLIVVDPRYTETAQQADLYLPIRPGEDAVLLAGMIRWTIEQDRYDQSFCERYTEGLDALAAAVAPYTLDVVAKRTGLDARLVEQACEIFTSARRGGASSGTGPDMGPHPNLSEHLILSLNTLCGRHNRAGDKVSTSLLTPDIPPMEAVVPWDFLPPTLNPTMNTRRSRVADAGQVYLEMPATTLPDEILTPGDGQVRALLVIGGNPMLSLPDPAKVERALAALDLLVCIDVRQTDTTAHADYLLPASYGLERPEMTCYADFLFDKPFHQFADKLVDAPGDAREEWVYLAELARRMNTEIPLPGGSVDLDNTSGDRDSALAVLDRLFPEGTSKLPARQIAAAEGGLHCPEYAEVEVQRGIEGMEDRLQFMPAGVAEEFAALASEPLDLQRPADGFMLICRRNKYVYNSMCHELSQTADGNPLYMHPDDLAAMGAQPGAVVEMSSAFGRTRATVAEDKTLRRGVVASSHNFGDPRNAQGDDRFARVSELLSLEYSNDPYARMPIMTAVPVELAIAAGKQ